MVFRQGEIIKKRKNFYNVFLKKNGVIGWNEWANGVLGA
jgi:hypothetical protein